MLAGEPAAYALCRPPGPSRLRRCRRRLLLPQQFGDRRAASAQGCGARRDPRRRPASRQRHARHLLCARRRADRVDPCRPGALLPVLLGPCRRARRGRRPRLPTSTCRCRANPATTVSSRRWRPACGASAPSRRKRWSWRSASTHSRAIRSAGCRSPRRASRGSPRAIAALGLPTVIVQEGGYLCDALGDNLTAFLTGYGGRTGAYERMQRPRLSRASAFGLPSARRCANARRAAT